MGLVSIELLTSNDHSPRMMNTISIVCSMSKNRSHSCHHMEMRTIVENPACLVLICFLSNYFTSQNFSVIHTNGAFFLVFSNKHTINKNTHLTNMHSQKSVSLAFTAVLVLYSQLFVYGLILNWVIQICAKTFEFWRKRFCKEQTNKMEK